MPQRPELRVGGHQLAQRGGAGARQADDEDRALDHLVVDLGVLLVGVLDLQPLDQGVADGRVLHHLAHLVEIGLGVQRLDGALQAFAVVGRAEVVRARSRRARRLRARRRRRSSGEPFCTARRRASMIAARSGRG